MKQACDKHWVQTADLKLPGTFLRVRCIKQHLLCCRGDDGIVVLDTDLQQQSVIPAGDMTHVNDVTHRKEHLVIAANSGLFYTELNGKN